MSESSDYSPFARNIAEPIKLTPGNRIVLNHRKGTFIGYYKMTSWPNVVEWLPDGQLDVEVSLWPSQGVLLSSWDDSDQLTDFDAWEYEL